MFCPKCGAQNPDGAGFCGSCGAQLEQRQAPAAQPVAAGGAASGAAGVASKAGLNPKIVGGVIGVVVLILLIVLISMFACSGSAVNLADLVTKPSDDVDNIVESQEGIASNGSTVNLADLVTKPSGDVANVVKGHKEMTFNGVTLYTNSEDFLKDLATTDGDPDVAKFKKYDGCYGFTMSKNSSGITLEDLNNGSDPDEVMFMMLIVSDKLTAKDVADRVAKLAPYDKVYVSKYSSGNISGMAKGNGCVTSFSASEKDGVWLLAMNTFAIDSEFGSSTSEHFDDKYESFDSSNYSDSYKK